MNQKGLIFLFIPALILSIIIFVILSRPSPPDAAEMNIYFKAAAAYDIGDFNSCLNLTSVLSDKCPAFFQARLLLGKAQFFSGMTGEAKETFERLIIYKNNYYEAEIWTLRCMIQTGNLADARIYGEELLSRAPEDPRILGMLARISAHDQDYGQALELYKRAMLFEEELAINRVDAGKIYFTLQNTGEAASQLERAAILADGDSPIRPALTELIKKIGENK